MIILTIWPLFALICLGFVMARAGFPEPGFWPAAERVNYYILFPALLVGSLAMAPLGDPAIWRLGGAAFVTICIAALGLYGWRWFRPTPAARFGPAVQGVIRINTYLGLAITTSLSGAAGIERAAVVLAVVVPLVNVLSIMALADQGGPNRLYATLRLMGRNPLILACLLGITLALTGIGLPFGSATLLSLLGQGSLPLGLLCVGAALRPGALRSDLVAIGTNSTLRLIGMPALAVVMAWTFGLNGVEALVLVIFFAIPTAPTSYVLTRQFGGDAPFMAGLVTAQTLASVLTIPLILLVFGAS
ncbi:AEC family transporter [Yoonia vestfoldensis]|uniref:AEC family transporter n=1 Tax=Yoonia vestfoldensis TaxID=245188 RepID=UPI0003764805|nr:AEC family transporter [Yoonia vestfoldensis]